MNHFNDTPIEIINEIFSYVIPPNFYLDELRICASYVYQIFNKRISLGTKNVLERLKKSYMLTKKYSKYYDQYKINDNYYFEKGLRDIKLQGNPILIDALFTECALPYASHSIYKFTQEVEQDIYDIVKYIPDVINSNRGTMRCRDYVPVLMCACNNEIIPLHIVKFLIDNGADINADVFLNGRKVPIMEDILIHCGLSENRKQQLIELFKK